MKLRINSCGISDNPPSWNWITAPKGFPDYDLWVVFRGKGKIGASDDASKAFGVYEGAALLLTPDTKFEAVQDPSYPLLTINAHFDFLDDNGKIIHPYGLTAKYLPDTALMRSLLMRMVSLFNCQKEEEAAVFLQASLTEFFIAETLNDKYQKNFWVHIIKEICNEIESIGNIPTLGEYAEKYSYSERYLGKMFTKICGISFSDYVANTRMSKAKMLLCHTDIPITQIAEEIGFYDTGHFTNTFKRVVGVSPLEYRNDPNKR